MCDILRSASDGRGRSVLIEGTAGMGRTRLLRSAMDAADEYGLHLLAARARALEQQADYSLAQQLMAGVGSILDDAAPVPDPGIASVLPGSASAWSGHLHCPFPYDPQPGAPAHALHPLTRLLTTGVPLLLAINDLQWADTASLRCLGYLMARLENTPVAVIATVALGETPNDPGHGRGALRLPAAASAGGHDRAGRRPSGYRDPRLPAEATARHYRWQRNMINGGLARKSSQNPGEKTCSAAPGTSSGTQVTSVKPADARARSYTARSG